MNQITLLQAVLIAAWVGLLMSRAVGYSLLTMVQTGMATGLVVGIIMHNVPQAMIITASIQLIYMGLIAPGANLPSVVPLGVAIALPIALVSALSPEQAIAIAVPVALLGSYFNTLRRVINAFYVHLTDRFASELNEKGMDLSTIVLPGLTSFLLFAILTFVAIYVGAPLVSQFIKVLPANVLHALNIVGGGLPAIGIALTLIIIGRKELLVFFFVAYFVSVMLKSLNVNMVVYAILGGAMAYLYVFLSKKQSVKG